MILFDRLEPYRLILASNSPRRRQLMTECGFRYDLSEPYKIEERYPTELALEEVAPYLAQLKSNGYPLPLAPNEILVTADTVVICEGRVLGKPRDRADAIAMLKALSGRTHRVVTGVVLRSAGKTDRFAAATDVRFRELRDEEIEFYVDRYRPFDKAGAYGIQEWTGYAAIECIEGSFYNVMGLPVGMLYTHLEKFIENP